MRFPIIITKLRRIWGYDCDFIGYKKPHKEEEYILLYITRIKRSTGIFGAFINNQSCTKTSKVK